MELAPSSGNVFLALGFRPEAAEVFGVTEKCMTNVICGKVDRISIDTLVNMLARAGLRIEFSVEPMSV